MCFWTVELHKCGHRGMAGDIYSCETPAGSNIACIMGNEEKALEVDSKFWLCAFKERYKETGLEVMPKEVVKPEITTAPETSTSTEPLTTTKPPKKKSKKRKCKRPKGREPPTEPRAMRTGLPSTKRKREEQEGKRDQTSTEARPRSTG